MKNSDGFTLIELMIVIAIIGVLAAIAVPQYQTYTARTKFSEVILATTKFKTAIDVCAAVKGSIPADNSCTTAGMNGIPPVVINANTKLANMSVASSGVNNASINATAVSTGGLNGETYTLQGVFTNSKILWSVGTGSTCLTNGLCSAN